jgi:hypothetical protein
MYTSSFNPIATAVPAPPPPPPTTTTNSASHQLITASLPSSPLVNANRMNHFAVPSSNQNHQFNSSGSSSKGMCFILS